MGLLIVAVLSVGIEVATGLLNWGGLVMALCLVNAGTTAFNTIFTYLRQRLVPREHLGTAGGFMTTWLNICALVGLVAAVSRPLLGPLSQPPTCRCHPVVCDSWFVTSRPRFCTGRSKRHPIMRERSGPPESFHLRFMVVPLRLSASSEKRGGVTSLGEMEIHIHMCSMLSTSAMGMGRPHKAMTGALT